MKSFSSAVVMIAVAVFPGCVESSAATAPTAEYFAAEKLPSIPRNAMPDHLWQDTGGRTARIGEHFYRLENSADTWAQIPGPAQAIPDRAFTVSADGRLYVVDGKEVHSLAYEEDKVFREDLPDLAVAAASGDIVRVSGTMYLAGRDTSGANIFLRGAKILEPWSGEVPERVLAAQCRGAVYVFSKDATNGQWTTHRYDPKAKTWERMATSEFSFPAQSAFAVGDAHILLLAEDSDQLAAFYTTQNRWVQFQSEFLPVSALFSDADGGTLTVVSGGSLASVEAVFPATNYGWLDNLVLLAFFVAMLWVGKRAGRHATTQRDFFRGGRQFPSWAIGLSLFATGASAISLMAMPAKAYMENWIYFTMGAFALLMLPIKYWLLIPIARRLQFSSAYEYLEARYCGKARVIGSFSFVAMQVMGRLATVMLLPAVAISAVFGIPVQTSILLMGTITTIYCMVGGFEAVVWTDVIQAFAMLFAVGFCMVWALFLLDVPVGDIWNLVQTENKLQIADLSWDTTQPIFAIILLSTFVNVFLAIGDQNFIQRVQAVPNEKMARQAVFTQLAVAVPMNGTLFALGTVLFIFYHFHPEDIPPAMKVDSIFPLFAAQNLPMGMAGLVIAALIASTMSTLSSALNSVSNVVVADFILPRNKNLSDRAGVFWGKGLTVAVGAIGTGIALWLSRANSTSIWDMILVILGILFSPLNSMFLLGVTTTRVHTYGLIFGFLVGYAVTAYAYFNLELHPFFYGMLGLIPSIVSAYVFCRIFPRRKHRDLSGLTIFSLPPIPDDEASDPHRKWWSIFP